MHLTLIVPSHARSQIRLSSRDIDTWSVGYESLDSQLEHDDEIAAAAEEEFEVLESQVRALVPDALCGHLRESVG